MENIRLTFEKPNLILDKKNPVQRMEWAIEYFEDVAIASAFGLEDVALLDMVYRELDHEVPVIFLDTLYHFEETLDLVDRFREEYGLRLEVYRPDEARTRREFENVYGKNLWEKDLDRFRQLTKLRQMKKALRHRDAWVAGLRREQSDKREEIRVLEWDDRHSLIKLNPLADWSIQDVRRYIEEHDVPYNPLHDRGYPSIGDEPLTESVEEQEHQRAGRRTDHEFLENGLHV